eukprot:XP_024444520.1 glutamine synthetase cytosolic isozyme 2-like [Populus trichocarpa]
MDTSYFCVNSSLKGSSGVLLTISHLLHWLPQSSSQGQYHCGVGVDKAFGPDIVDAHFKACLHEGINISGINGEVMPGQVGLLVCISAGDELWAAWHILERIIDVAGVVLPFDPKPIEKSDLRILHIFSTKSMRNKGGYEVIKKAVEKRGLRHIKRLQPV